MVVVRAMLTACGTGPSGGPFGGPVGGPVVVDVGDVVVVGIGMSVGDGDGPFEESPEELQAHAPTHDANRKATLAPACFIATAFKGSTPPDLGTARVLALPRTK